MANNYSVNPVNLLCTEDQMHYIIEHSEAHALLVSEEWEARAQVFLKDRPGMALFVMNPHQLQMPVTKKAGQDLVLGPHPSDLALLMYTSGANSQRFGAVTGRIAPNFASQVMPSGFRFWCRSWCKFGARVL
jgi:long-subunit acyl-CoA synthetase (AMP-forming)